MNERNEKLSDNQILEVFKKKAIKLISERMDIQFKFYKDERKKISDLIKGKEFQDDIRTFNAILDKYRMRYDFDFGYFLLYIEDNDGYLGEMEIDGVFYPIHDVLFDTPSGINVLRKILDLLDIEYDCRYCLKRPTCDVFEKLNTEKCEYAVEMGSSYLNNKLIMDILHKLIEKES